MPKNNTLYHYQLGQAGWSTGTLINSLGLQNGGHLKG